MAENILRKSQTGEPTVNGGQFAAKQYTEAEASLPAEPKVPDVSDAVDEFLFGSPQDLTVAQATTVNRLTSHMPVKPDVAVHDTDRVDLIYTFPQTAYTDERTVRLTLDAGGRLVGAGDGENWDDNYPEQDDYLRLLDAGFGE